MGKKKNYKKKTLYHFAVYGYKLLNFSFTNFLSNSFFNDAQNKKKQKLSQRTLEIYDFSYCKGNKFVVSIYHKISIKMRNFISDFIIELKDDYKNMNKNYSCKLTVDHFETIKITILQETNAFLFFEVV